jgi:isocitrate/isopropylmalate dehydrogenase
VSSSPTPITVARGDGIGPEIMDATLRVLEAYTFDHGGSTLDRIAVPVSVGS